MKVQQNVTSEVVRSSPSSHADGSAKSLHKLPIKVALVEDQPKVRENWTKLIDNFPDFHCVCSCTSAEEAVRSIPATQPDIILMDIFLPRMSGIECTARLKEMLPETQIIILTAMDDQELVFMALEAGADGYLLKRTKPSELRAALLDVRGGGAPMTSQIARRVIESFRRKTKLKSESTVLTTREEQILLLLSQGHANKLIAAKLGVSLDTVCSHLKNIFRKMHVNSRTEAALRFVAWKSALKDPNI